MIHLNYGIQPQNYKSDTYNIDESYRHYFQQMKRDIKDNIPCNSIYIKFKNRPKKKKLMEIEVRIVIMYGENNDSKSEQRPFLVCCEYCIFEAGS